MSKPLVRQTPLVRQALDVLLKRYPDFDVVSVEWQVDPGDNRSVARWDGPWVLVDLGQPSEHMEIEPAWAVHQFAIWRTTGAVHRIGPEGAVEDEPIIGGWHTEGGRS